MRILVDSEIPDNHMRSSVRYVLGFPLDAVGITTYNEAELRKLCVERHGSSYAQDVSYRETVREALGVTEDDEPFEWCFVIGDLPGIIRVALGRSNSETYYRYEPRKTNTDFASLTYFKKNVHEVHASFEWPQVVVTDDSFQAALARGGPGSGQIGLMAYRIYGEHTLELTPGQQDIIDSIDSRGDDDAHASGSHDSRRAREFYSLVALQAG